VAEPVTEPTTVSVAGLEIPADVAALVIVSFRGLYPDITSGKDDDAAVRAVLRWFITSTMETHAGREATKILEAAIAQLRAKDAAAAGARREQIHAAAGRIKEKPPV